MGVQRVSSRALHLDGPSPYAPLSGESYDLKESDETMDVSSDPSSPRYFRCRLLWVSLTLPLIWYSLKTL